MPRKQHIYHYVYKTTNSINHKFYIGLHSTSNLEDGYIGSGTLLARAITKYGRENFSMEIIEFCEDRDKIKLRESELVTQDVLNDPMCMNLRLGGDNGIGTFGKTHTKRREYKPLSESHKAALSKAALGKNGKYERTSEVKEKTSTALKDQKQSEETKRKRSESLKKFWLENPKAKELREQKRQLMKSNNPKHLKQSNEAL